MQFTVPGRFLPFLILKCSQTVEKVHEMFTNIPKNVQERQSRKRSRSRFKNERNTVTKSPILDLKESIKDLKSFKNTLLVFLV